MTLLFFFETVDPMSGMRTFIAVEIPARQRKVLSRLALACSGAKGLSFVEEQGLHLTLNFVGNVDDREVPDLCGRVSKVTRGRDPFELQLGGLGAFPDMSRPRAFWIGLVAGSEILRDLNAKYRDILEEMGFLQEKKYVPHLTLARSRPGQVLPESVATLQKAYGSLQLEPFAIDRVIVYMSTLEHSGPTHVPLSTIRLE
ncbi:MAG: RNA 2',3'-cyclic phosphodiesterase [Pirellulaceae bacterium]|nr:RNA 2',3'-cyclic phosphodiesterase [Pirellulaceae bacterium]